MVTAIFSLFHCCYNQQWERTLGIGRMTHPTFGPFRSSPLLSSSAFLEASVRPFCQLLIFSICGRACIVAARVIVRDCRRTFCCVGSRSSRRRRPVARSLARTDAYLGQPVVLPARRPPVARTDASLGQPVRLPARSPAQINSFIGSPHRSKVIL